MQLEFYSELHKQQSPLVNHVPGILSSGVIVQEPDGSYKNYSWSGHGIPDLVEALSLVDEGCLKGDLPFGVWGKMKLLSTNNAVITSPKICPYLISKRCRGDIFANLYVITVIH